MAACRVRRQLHRLSVLRRQGWSASRAEGGIARAPIANARVHGGHADGWGTPLWSSCLRWHNFVAASRSAQDRAPEDTILRLLPLPLRDGGLFCVRWSHHQRLGRNQEGTGAQCLVITRAFEPCHSSASVQTAPIPSVGGQPPRRGSGLRDADGVFLARASGPGLLPSTGFSGMASRGSSGSLRRELEIFPPSGASQRGQALASTPPRAARPRLPSLTSGGAGSASAIRAVITNPPQFAEQCDVAALRAGDHEERAVMIGAPLPPFLISGRQAHPFLGIRCCVPWHAEKGPMCCEKRSISNAMSARPFTADGVAELVRQLAPYFRPASALLA